MYISLCTVVLLYLNQLFFLEETESTERKRKTKNNINNTNLQWSISGLCTFTPLLKTMSTKCYDYYCYYCCYYYISILYLALLCMHLHVETHFVDYHLIYSFLCGYQIHSRKFFINRSITPNTFLIILLLLLLRLLLLWLLFFCHFHIYVTRSFVVVCCWCCCCCCCYCECLHSCPFKVKHTNAHIHLIWLDHAHSTYVDQFGNSSYI